MTTFNSIKRNILRHIPYAEITVGVVLICLEMYNYTSLYTRAEFDETWGGAVDAFKYKEDVYAPVFLYAILTFAGISYWINKKRYWIFTQTFLLMLLCKGTLFFYLEFFPANAVAVPIIRALYVLLLVWIEYKLVSTIQIDSVPIDNRTKIYGSLLGVICFGIYLILL